MNINTLSQTAVAVCTAIAWGLPVLAGWFAGQTFRRRKFVRIVVSVLVFALVTGPAMAWSDAVCEQALTWLKSAGAMGIRFM